MAGRFCSWPKPHASKIPLKYTLSMSKHLLSFLLSELRIVRVICGHCHDVVELPIERLGTRVTDGTCPLCKRDLLPRDQADLLLRLDNAISALKDCKKVDIEFVIPAKPGE